jgi:hypothetical protein
MSVFVLPGREGRLHDHSRLRKHGANKHLIGSSDLNTDLRRNENWAFCGRPRSGPISLQRLLAKYLITFSGDARYGDWMRSEIAEEFAPGGLHGFTLPYLPLPTS